MASCLFQLVVEAFFAARIFDNGHTFHEVRNCDLVAFDGDVDGGGGGAVGGDFME